MALSQVHKSCLWGWDDEPWGPVSTMRLDIIDKCQAYIDRENAGQEQPEEPDYEIRSIVAPAWRDEEYDQFKKIMFERGMTIRWDDRLTASDSKELEHMSSEVIREILAA